MASHPTKLSSEKSHEKQGRFASLAFSYLPNLSIREPIDATVILDSLGDGVYVTDVQRKIVYWNKKD